MLGVDDLGESGCPRWSYGDGVLNTASVSFTQNIHSVNLSYVLYRIQVVPGGHMRMVSNTGYESFTQKIQVKLSYVSCTGGQIRMIVHTAHCGLVSEQ